MSAAEKKPLVLIVDDDSIGTRVLVKIVESRGFEAFAVNESERALDLAERAAPDLILLDVSMPILDGFEVCRRLKQRDATRATPIIFISGMDQTIDKVRGFSLGAVDYITKPYQADEVAVRVETQLRLFALQRAADARNQELERALAELEQRNAQLLASQRSLGIVFTALSETMEGKLLDGRYRLEERIGKGGFGSVFRGRHVVMDREVAVKVLQPPGTSERDASLERFRREAMTACRFDHPNSVAVLDAGISPEGLPYLVMELLKGVNLLDEMRRVGKVGVKRAAELLVPVCDVLTRAHARRLAHRDIKPENIFLSRMDGVETVKVLDFGLATLHDDAVTGHLETGSVIGTPAYMAPELFADDSRGDPRTADVYALGVTLYELLTRRRPFAEPSANNARSILQARRAGPVPLRSVDAGIPKAIDALVSSALSFDSRPTIAELGFVLRQHR